MSNVLCTRMKRANNVVVKRQFLSVLFMTENNRDNNLCDICCLMIRRTNEISLPVSESLLSCYSLSSRCLVIVSNDHSMKEIQISFCGLICPHSWWGRSSDTRSLPLYSLPSLWSLVCNDFESQQNVAESLVSMFLMFFFKLLLSVCLFCNRKYLSLPCFRSSGESLWRQLIDPQARKSSSFSLHLFLRHDVLRALSWRMQWKDPVSLANLSWRVASSSYLHHDALFAQNIQKGDQLQTHIHSQS